MFNELTDVSLQLTKVFPKLTDVSLQVINVFNKLTDTSSQFTKAFTKLTDVSLKNGRVCVGLMSVCEEKREVSLKFVYIEKQTILAL